MVQNTTHRLYCMFISVAAAIHASGLSEDTPEKRAKL